MCANFIKSTFYAVDCAEKNFEVKISINPPVGDLANSYVTELSIVGINSSPQHYSVKGADPIQSLLIAIGFIKSNLQLFEKKGGRIFLNPLRTDDFQYSRLCPVNP